jgi:hypothetical protein
VRGRRESKDSHAHGPFGWVAKRSVRRSYFMIRRTDTFYSLLPWSDARQISSQADRVRRKARKRDLKATTNARQMMYSLLQSA